MKKDKAVVYSALEVANICSVVNQTAINWIRGGHLKAFKTPGGQFRVYPEDLVIFMQGRKMHVPKELMELSRKKNADKTILVVDDDKGLNSVIMNFLSRRLPGYTIYQAFDGFDAGAKMTEYHPACLILDLDLPGIDGFDLCKRINEDEKFEHPSIIIVTALEDSNIEKRVHDMGVKKFFKKPLNLPELIKTVLEL